jgi:hypothetical protein
MARVRDRSEREGRPLVIFICATPLLKEAIVDALEEIAEVQSFPAGGGDTNGLLRWLGPNAVVVDRSDEAEAAAPFAREAHAPLLHIALTERKLRLLRGNHWVEAAGDGASAEHLRNVLVGMMYGRGGNGP